MLPLNDSVCRTRICENQSRYGFHTDLDGQCQEALDSTPISKSSQVKYRLLHGRLERIGEASADTAATETYYMKGIIIWKKKRLK